MRPRREADLVIDVGGPEKARVRALVRIGSSELFGGHDDARDSQTGAPRWMSTGTFACTGLKLSSSSLLCSRSFTATPFTASACFTRMQNGLSHSPSSRNSAAPAPALPPLLLVNSCNCLRACKAVTTSSLLLLFTLPLPYILSSDHVEVNFAAIAKITQGYILSSDQQEIVRQVHKDREKKYEKLLERIFSSFFFPKKHG